jgi:oligopeptidase B
MNDRENPEVIDYLNKENDYYQQSTAHNERFSEEFI